MHILNRVRSFGGSPFLVALTCCAVLTCSGLFGGAFEEEVEEGESYIRNVDSPPSLAETEQRPGWSYNSDFLFAICRSIRDSSVPLPSASPHPPHATSRWVRSDLKGGFIFNRW